MAAIVVDAAGRVLLGLGRGSNAYWHFPQGGVGSKETLEDALRRELQEEAGLPPSAYHIVAQYGGLRYRYRRNNDKSERWRGQQQTYFLLRCHAEMPRVDCSHTEECSILTWVSQRELGLELFAPFKRKVVGKVIAHFFPASVSSGAPGSSEDELLTSRRYRWRGRALSLCPADDRSLFAGSKEEMISHMEKLGLRLRAAQKRAALQGCCRLLVLVHGAAGSGRRQCLRRLASSLEPFGVQLTRRADAFTSAPGLPWTLLECLPEPGKVSFVLHDATPESPVPQQWPLLESWLAGQGVTLLKLYLNASPAEGAATAPRAAADEHLLAATQTENAPWYIIPADRRWYRDYVVASLVAEAMEG